MKSTIYLSLLSILLITFLNNIQVCISSENLKSEKLSINNYLNQNQLNTRDIMIKDDFSRIPKKKISKPHEKLQSKVYLIESLIEYSTQKDDIKHNFTYNENGKLLTYNKQVRENNSWENVRRETYSYNENDQILSKLNEVWNDYNWVNEYRHIYEYDSNDNLLIDYEQNWTIDKWTNKNRFTKTYDGNHNLMSSLKEIGFEDQWNNSSLETYEFYENQHMKYYLKQNWQDTRWVNYWQTSWSYYPDGKIEHTQNSQWDDNRYAWMCNGVDYFKYDSLGNTISIINEKSGWSYPCVEERKRLYTYDYRGNLLKLEDSHWIGKWALWNQKNYKYDDNDNPIYYLYEWAEDPGGPLIFREQHYYSYDGLNNLLSEKVERIENEQWVNYKRYTQTYDSTGNFLSHLYEQWSDSIWLPVIKHNYYYDDRSNQITRVDERAKKEDSLVKDLRYSYSYDMNNNLQSILFEIWDNDQWIIHDTTLSFNDYFGNRSTYNKDYKLELSWADTTLVVQIPIDISGKKSSCEFQNKNYRIDNGEYENIHWLVNGGSITSYYPDSLGVCVQWGETGYGKIILELTEDGISRKFENNISIYPSPKKLFITRYDNKLVASDSLNINWYLNGNFIGGANSQYYEPTEEGNYSVTTTNEYGCESDMSESYFFDNSIGVTETLSKDYLSITPNPITESTTIQVNIDSPGNIKLEINDYLGQQIKELYNGFKESGRYSITFHSGLLSPGIYFCTLRTGGYVETMKIVIVK